MANGKSLRIFTLGKNTAAGSFSITRQIPNPFSKLERLPCFLMESFCKFVTLTF